MDYKKFLIDFESKIIVPGYKKRILGTGPRQPVPLKPGKLSNHPLGVFLGKTFESPIVLSINYYGYFKLSSGIYDRIERVHPIFMVSTAMSPVVYFNSIHAKHIEAIDISMLDKWDSFKEYIADMRWK